MKSFKQFIKEEEIPSGWRPLKGTEEHDEVEHQLDSHNSGDAEFHPLIVKALQHLSSPKNYSSAIKNSTTEVFNREKLSNVQNTDAASSWKESQKDLDPEKVERANQQADQMKAGKIKLAMPVIIRATNSKTGETVEHNLSGNTRLSRHGDVGVPTHVINFKV
jgi:hypothetical protein